MLKIGDFLKRHRPIVVLLGIVLVLTAIPVLDTFLVIGNSWQGILPVFTDELNLARVHTIGEGHFTAGNAYYLEHADGPPLVIFGGAWLNALPLWTGMSLNSALMLNFIVWSLLFAATLYYLLRELRVPPWISVFGTVFLYLQSYGHVWRPANLQPVFPFYFLFYAMLLRFIRTQNRKNILLLGLMVGATFYIFAYLWQIAVITMGLLFLYALVRKNRSLLKTTLTASLLGGFIGMPVLLYMLWLSHASPYFWESISRFGLVNTHLPMAEVIYSGGWIGVTFILLALLFWRVSSWWSDEDISRLGLFILISGLGLWIMQGSNLITGKLLETGEHVRMLILPWLFFTTLCLGTLLWRRRFELSKTMKIISTALLTLLMAANVYFTYYYFSPFVMVGGNRELWQLEQLYAKPLAWIDSQQKEPVVIWSDPHDYLASVLPIYSRDFTLDSYWGMLELVPEGEVRERYLVSQYFNNPTLADLKSESEMGLYLGRSDLFHKPATYNRRVKVCRILFFWDRSKDCGAFVTPQEMLGDAFFVNLADKFQNDVKPNIKAYLKKYHVSYIMKDMVLNQKYHPEVLGAKLVYSDGRFEIYRL